MTKRVKFWIFGVTVLCLLAVVIYFAPSWSATTRTGNSTLSLTPEQISQLEKKVQAGDSEAAMRLSDYYLFYRKDPKNGFIYREEAAILGSDKAKVWVKGFIELHGLDAYRETIARTNHVRERQLLENSDKQP